MTTAPDPIVRIRELLEERKAEAPPPFTPDEVGKALEELLAGEGEHGIMVATAFVYLGAQIAKTIDQRGSALEAIDHLARRLDELERRPAVTSTERALLGEIFRALTEIDADLIPADATRALRNRLIELNILDEPDGPKDIVDLLGSARWAGLRTMLRADGWRAP